MTQPARPDFSKPPAPSSVEELLSRARRIAGLRVGELAERQGLELSGDGRRTKGAVGQLVERALGADAGSRAEPDFVAVGVELKTVPVNAHGAPRESTFVCSIPLNALPEIDFEHSPVWHKLRRVLFVPIEADPALPLPQRRIGSALLFEPDADERRLFEADWDLLAGLIASGEVDRLSAHLGEALQVRPKAANGRARRLAPDAEGGIRWAQPRGFYLRARFTAQILRRGFR